MKRIDISRRATLPFILTSCLYGALIASGCSDGGAAGITDATGDTAGQGGSDSVTPNEPKGGSQSSSSGSGSVESGGDRTEGETGKAPSAGSGGSDSDGDSGDHDSGGSGGSSAAPEGAAGEAGEAAEGGAPGTGEQPHEGVHIAQPCAFHTDAPPPSTGSGGEGPVAEVLAQPNAFVGNYLTDGAGRTLYTYGADLPGDCQTAPQSTCVADCVVSWPIFNAAERVLGAGLDDAAFGSIQRADGAVQTTYMGWPLYYYKADLTLGQLTGQGKGKTWHAAELVPPTITIMKVGTLKYLADAYGHTLYISAADTAGTLLDDPISNCGGGCLDTFEPFHEKKMSTVTSLQSQDFVVFVRQGAGGLQLSYKGLPLYRAATDLKSGDMNGTAVPGFTAAAP